MDANKFLASYKQAWETRNADLAASLFTSDAHYWETPFGEPLFGRKGIRDYWQAATQTQEDIHFTVRDSFTFGHTLIAEWSCTYTHRPTRSPTAAVPAGRQADERRELRGILLAEFYGELVRSFREYWHRRML